MGKHLAQHRRTVPPSIESGLKDASSRSKPPSTLPAPAEGGSVLKNQNGEVRQEAKNRPREICFRLLFVIRLWYHFHRLKALLMRARKRYRRAVTSTYKKDLIRPRENVIRYGSPFVVVTDDPASELDRQYENLVSLPCIPLKGSGSA